MREFVDGRQDRDRAAEDKIKRKLECLPSVFSEYHTDMIGDEKSVKTRTNYILYVSTFAKHFCDGEIDPLFYQRVAPSDIKAWVAAAEGESTRCGRWAALNSFFSYLKSCELIEGNPVLKTNPPKNRKEHQIVYLDEDEIAQVYKNIYRKSSLFTCARDTAIITLFLTTGLRCSALIQINDEDLDLKNKCLTVVEKGNVHRAIYLGDKTVEVLKHWITYRDANYKKNSNALFLSKGGLRLKDSHVRDLVEKMTEDIDKHITPHKLRSTAATTLAANGVPIHVIKNILGHRNIQTTMRYTAAVERDVENAVNVLDKIVGGET